MDIAKAVDQIRTIQVETNRPIAIVLAGHNGSGKSTMWRAFLSDELKIPLINADRMFMSILPEVNTRGFLVPWAQELRDNNRQWMQVAQNGVNAFMANAMQAKVPFAVETVFSYWEERDGEVFSKIDWIKEMQAAGYFVLLLFVGLTSAKLSMARVAQRAQAGGHTISPEKLVDRFPRTQKAIRAASAVADATILTDNSRTEELAFTVCQVQIKEEKLFDLRNGDLSVPRAITQWMDIVCP